MKFRICTLAAVLFLNGCGGQEESTKAMEWPQLPSENFIEGRAAEKADVASGKAVLSMDGQSAGPIDITIPQYALWTDEVGQDHPVVVVQAERAPTGMEIVGLLMMDGTTAAATMSELTLIGGEAPNK